MVVIIVCYGVARPGGFTVAGVVGAARQGGLFGCSLAKSLVTLVLGSYRLTLIESRLVFAL